MHGPTAVHQPHLLFSPVLLFSTCTFSNCLTQDSRGIGSQGTILQNEVIIDRSLISPKIENVKQEIRGLEVKISKLEESLESLNKLQQR
jgi:hypothetical protein